MICAKTLGILSNNIMINKYLNQIVEVKKFFDSKITIDYNFRIKQLKKLKLSLQKYEVELLNALKEDLKRSNFESYASEIGLLYKEIDFTISKLKKWLKPIKVHSSLIFFPATSKIYSVPLGVVLIIAPWNYPVWLLISPLIGAIAGGNCAILKTSELTKNVVLVLEKLFKETFEENYILFIDGDGKEVIPPLISNFQFNHVFFTGSLSVGQIITKLCANYSIPNTLELGGKSPAIIHNDADIYLSCKRIIWGKMFNNGQTCVAPDYLVIHSQIFDAVLSKLKFYIDFFTKGSNLKIFNYPRYNILKEYINTNQDKIIYGGEFDDNEQSISFSLMLEPDYSSKINHEEVFGPILPIFKYNSFDDVYNIINKNPNPLSLYLFTNSTKLQEKVINEIAFGGGCINTCLFHTINYRLPFGGIMQSGFGKYHGKYSFDLFTHKKSILKMYNWFDAFIKYPPYSNLKYKLLKMLYKISQ